MFGSRKDDLTLQDEEVEEANCQVDLNTILVNELGQFGKFQLKLTVVCSIAAIFSAWSAAEYLFTTARIYSRCLIPECDSNSPEFYPPWVYNAIPGSPGSLDNCHRFAGNSSYAYIEQTCPAILFNRNTLEDCESYVFENTDTVVYDFGLACDEWRRTMIGSLRIIGTLFSLPVTGYISDRWGRRLALTITGFNGAWLGATRYFTNSYIAFSVSQVIEALVSTGFYTSAYILLLEVLGPKYRTIAGAIVKTFWAVGHTTLGLLAWGVPNWRMLTLTVFIPQLLSISFFWTVTESARWYISNGRFEEAKTVLQAIAKTNGITICLQSVEVLRPATDGAKRKKEKDKIEHKAKKPWLIVLIFKHKKVLLTCVVASIWWITDILVYYGLSINAVNIGNRYFNYMAVSAVEIPGYWIAVLLIDRIGRKPVLAGAFWVCAACQVAYIFIPHDYFRLALMFFLLGKCSIAIVTSVLYIYTVELYPTKHRHSLFAFNSMIGRIGSMIAPLTPAMGASTFEEFPFVLFGSLSLLSGMLIFVMPETLGTKLPDSMEEAENLQK